MATRWHFHATSDAACTPINRMFNSFCSAAAVPANPCMPNYSVMLPCSGSISCGTCHILAWALYTWPSCHHGTNHNDTFKNGCSGSLHAVLAWFISCHGMHGSLDELHASLDRLAHGRHVGSPCLPSRETYAVV